MLSTKTVNPATNRPYPIGVLEEAVKGTGYDYSRREKKVKVMFLEVVQRIRDQGVLPLERAKMRIKVTAKDFEEHKERMPVGALFEGGDGKGGNMFLLPPR